MILSRRDLVKATTAVATVAAATSVSACSPPIEVKDELGQQIINFLRDGDEGLLNKLFADTSTLVAFDNRFIADTDKLFFTGVAEIGNAMLKLRKQLTADGFGKTPRGLDKATLVLDRDQSRMNNIEIVFAEAQATETSCGPTRSEWSFDLFYEGGSDYGDNETIEVFIAHLALIPHLVTDRENG